MFDTISQFNNIPKLWFKVEGTDEIRYVQDTEGGLLEMLRQKGPESCMHVLFKMMQEMLKQYPEDTVIRVLDSNQHSAEGVFMTVQLTFGKIPEQYLKED